MFKKNIQLNQISLISKPVSENIISIVALLFKAKSKNKTDKP